MALAVSNGWEVHHLDVKTAFLHGDLKEDVYISQPEDFVIERKESKVYKLNKVLEQLNFGKCPKEPVMYRNREKDHVLLIDLAKKILSETKMEDCNAIHAPMDPGLRLSKGEEEKNIDETEYMRNIGCLRYLLHTRPDLSYCVGVLARYTQQPKESHSLALKQVLSTYRVRWHMFLSSSVHKG